MQSVFAKCIGSISRAKRAAYLLLVGMLGVAMGTKFNDVPKEAHMNLFFQLRVWCQNLVKHIKYGRYPMLNDDENEAQVKPFVQEHFAANYKHYLMKHVFPLLRELADNLDISENNSESHSTSKWRTGGRLLGAAIKLVVGISFLQGGQAFDSFKEFAEVLHGHAEIYHGAHELGHTFSIGSCLKKAMKKITGKGNSLSNRKFIVDENLSTALSLFEKGLNDTQLEMQANGNRLRDEQFRAIIAFQTKLMERIGQFQTACKEKRGNHTTRFFYRMVENKLDELQWPNCKSPDVDSVLRISKLEEMVSDQSEIIHNLKWFIGGNYRRSTKNCSDLRKHEENEELANMLRKVGCGDNVIADLYRLDSFTDSVNNDDF